MREDGDSLLRSQWRVPGWRRRPRSAQLQSLIWSRRGSRQSLEYLPVHYEPNTRSDQTMWSSRGENADPAWCEERRGGNGRRRVCVFGYSSPYSRLSLWHFPSTAMCCTRNRFGERRDNTTLFLVVIDGIHPSMVNVLAVGIRTETPEIGPGFPIGVLHCTKQSKVRHPRERYIQQLAAWGRV